MQFGTGIQERKKDKYTVTLDGRNSTLEAAAPEKKYFRDEQVYTNPSDLLQHATPSFSLIRIGKIKNFQDGVYAAVEQRVAETDHHLSLPDFLRDLETRVEGDARDYVALARSGQLDEPSVSVVQGFYDWDPRLRDFWRQIKILGMIPAAALGDTENKGRNKKIMKELERVFRASTSIGEAHNTLVELYSRMTGEPSDYERLLPPAKLPDQEFFKKLSFVQQDDILQGLGKALITAIKEGKIDFAPDNSSGLYIWQMHEIVPLVTRNTPEFERFQVNKEYGKILEEEFISQWAGTRHTHLGHTDYSAMLDGASIDFNPIPVITIRPEVQVEPFFTCYERMAKSLEFMQQTVREFMPEVLDRGRLMNDGSRQTTNIGEEFEKMNQLLKGLGLVAKESLHIPYKDDKEARQAAQVWLGEAKNDLDINRNMATFVPIIRTTKGDRQIAYINAGFKLTDVYVDYNKFPKVEVTGGEVDVNFGSQLCNFPVMVHREVRLPYENMINDRRLRELLKSRSFSESDLEEVVRKLERE